MGFLKKTKTTVKQPFSSLFLSLSFHLLVLAFFIIPHFHTEVFQQKEFSVMEARLVEYVPPIKKEIYVSSEKKSRAHLSEARLAEKPVLTSRKKTLSVLKPIPSIAYINKESLQNDIRYVAENTVFKKTKTVSFSEQKASSLAYQSYVNACREKLMRVGNVSNKADKDGTVTLHVTIGRNGEVVKRFADSSDSLDLVSAVFDVVDSIRSFGPFPKEVSLQTIKINIPIHFVTR